MREDWIEAIKTIVDENRIRLQEPMSRHTTFRIGGMAEIFLMPTIKEAVDVITLCRAKKIPYTIIGNGSNLLVGDKGIPGVVIEFGANASSIEVKENMIHAEAGALLSKVAHKALEASLGGMEFAAGIPGSIGGAVVMNAGAYGGEMKDIVQNVTVLTREGEIRELEKEELGFGYRASVIKDRGYVVLGAELMLVPGDKEEILARMQELKNKRVEKQPLEYPSAGSAFKRPEGYFAGKLVMDAGFSGYAVGGAKVSEKHCGFLINAGGATASDVMELIRQIQDIPLTAYEEIVTDEPEVWQLLKDTFPEKTVRLYQDPSLSLSRLYRLDFFLQEALSRKVWLPCGGYLVIEPTEAMVVIDVNSGKAVHKGRSSQDYYRKVNREAAAEIARQLQLRNYSGMIMVDFINMESEKDQKELLFLLDQLLKKDQVRTRLVDMTALGIVEITRKKINRPLFEEMQKNS